MTVAKPAPSTALASAARPAPHSRRPRSEVNIPPPWIDPAHPYWSNRPMTPEQTALTLIDASATTGTISTMLDALVEKPDLRAKPESWDAVARAEENLTTTLLLGRDSLIRYYPGEQPLHQRPGAKANLATILGTYAQEYARIGGKAALVAQGLRQGIDATQLLLGKDTWHSLEIKTGAITQASVNLLRNGTPAP